MHMQLEHLVCVNVYMYMYAVEVFTMMTCKFLLTVQFVPGSSNSSTRGASDWLHVWEGGVFCRHGLQECQLL